MMGKVKWVRASKESYDQFEVVFRLFAQDFGYGGWLGLPVGRPSPTVVNILLLAAAGGPRLHLLTNVFTEPSRHGDGGKVMGKLQKATLGPIHATPTLGETVKRDMTSLGFRRHWVSLGIPQPSSSWDYTRRSCG